MNKQIFPALTGFRAIAAYMVFLYHLISFRENIFSPELFDLFNEFHVGVTMFFVLSGFLITHRYYGTKDFNFRDYIKNRFARIYPMYFILTTATLIYFAVFDNDFNKTTLKVYLLSITFLRSFFKDYIFAGIGQGWTLTVEEMFYFSAPFLFFLVKRNKFYLFIIPIIMISLGLLLESFFGPLNIYGFLKSETFIIDFTYFGRITEFVIGIGLSLFYNEYNNKFRTKYVTIIGLLITFSFVFLMSKINTGDGSEIGITSYWGKLINNLLMPLFGIAPLYWGLMTEKTFLSRILSTKLALLLGSSSYIFYLIHVGMFSRFFLLITSNLILVFIFLNIVSILMYKFLETPLNRFFRKL